VNADVIARARQEAADRLVELQGDRARLDAESRNVAAQTGPALRGDPTIRKVVELPGWIERRCREVAVNLADQAAFARP